MSRKTATFTQLLEYINKPKERGETPLLFNLQNNNDDLNAISKEFQANSNFRKQKGSTRNNLYHEILSFPEGDKEHLTLDIIQDLCTKYLELRSPNSLAYAKVHGDTKNPHIHIMISSNDLRSSKSNRISKQRFKQIKQELELYQIKKYPQLIQPLPITRKSPQRHSSSNQEVQIQKRGEIPQKTKIKTLVLSSFEKTQSFNEFIELLKNSALEFYKRSEKTCGVIDLKTNKKYRFKTLGIQENFEKFQRTLKRNEDFQEIEMNKLTLQIKIEINQKISPFINKKQSKKIRRKENRIARRKEKSKDEIPQYKGRLRNRNRFK